MVSLTRPSASATSDACTSNTASINGVSQVSGSSSQNIGVRGVANNAIGPGGAVSNVGVQGETSSPNSYAVMGAASGANVGGVTTGVYGRNTATGPPASSDVMYGVYGNSTGSGGTRIGVLGLGIGGDVNVAGWFNSGGQLVIPSSVAFGPPALPRTFNGSMFVQAVASGQGRIYWMSNGGQAFFVNSSGVGDVSEYFRAADRTLAIGEVVALDPDHANAVRRARPRDAATTVGVVSQFGTRGNDDSQGARGEDPDYVNVGLTGQVPVLVTLENGSIKPGDPLTASRTLRGRAMKAIGAGRIIGYATTHFPYVNGEKHSPDDQPALYAEPLAGDHVMCYLNVGWYAPTEHLGDGVEPPARESAFEARRRLNKSLNDQGNSVQPRR